MTVEAIMAVCTTLVTYFFGELNKKANLTDKNFIPIQNLTIGFITGLIVWAVGLNESIITSLVICTISAFGAGGAYDLTKTRKEVENEDNEFSDKE